MKAIEFPEVNVIYAKDQKQYLPLPVYRDRESVATACYVMTWKERLKVLFTGKIWVSVMTFSKPLQPQRLSVDCPFEKK